MEQPGILQEVDPKKSIVVRRRSFLGVLLLIGFAGMNAVLTISGEAAPMPITAAVKAPGTNLEIAKSGESQINSAPDKTNVAAANSQTSSGRTLFVASGCMACHGKNAAGTQFAPSLIDITKKYPPDQLTDLLRHPKAAMRAGGMPPVTVNDTQMKELVAYLSELGAVSANSTVTASLGTPPASASSKELPASSSVASSREVSKTVPATPLSADAVRGKVVFQHNRCETCHGVGGLNGTVAAPGLAGMASDLSASVLDDLLQHHSTQMKNGNMPPTNVNAATRKALVAYIRSMPSPPDAK